MPSWMIPDFISGIFPSRANESRDFSAKANSIMHSSEPYKLTAECRSVYADILSQAITGEVIGMQNFASLVGLVETIEEKMEAVEHAESEKKHALAFQNAADELGVEVVIDLAAPYWQRIRTAFLNYADRKDLTACLLIQELMLESFAVSTYESVAEVAPDSLARVFRAIAEDEKGHLEHVIEFLEAENARDPEAFTEKVHQVHGEVMTVLAEMVARGDLNGHCGLCRGECVKRSLDHVHLEIGAIRGRALNFYLQMLDRLGLPGERTLQWIANLPV